MNVPFMPRYLSLISVCLVFGFNLANDQIYAKLPYCDDIVQPAVFVSTLDGKLSALDAKGTFLWDIETGPGPLLISNIHKLELTNNGQWIRIIPSLSGSLYKFNGKSVDAIPITADSLLKSSFLYSDDLVIAGGREVRTYGIAMESGEYVYECSLAGCKNRTENPSFNFDNMVVVERSTITVRAHEPRSGSERWNFSVGLHNIKIPTISCINLNADVMNFNLSAVLPEGQLTARSDVSELWTYKFESPIVTIWKFNGRDIIPIDLFDYSKSTEENALSPAIYVGMHNKQLYIYESEKMLNALHYHSYGPSSEVVESRSIATIPWKPVPATGLAIMPAENDDSTAFSVLYSSEYVNGNGYYLYTEKDLEKKNTLFCDNNSSQYILEGGNDEDDDIVGTLWFWWKEIFLISMSTAVALNFLWNRYDLPFRRLRVIPRLEEPAFSLEKERTISESSDAPFTSRFTNDFETVRCLGKGGFGVVFEVKQKIDECGYAIKRITLPNESKSRERVMREVKTLAKLEHPQIVRYYNSWVEAPPAGWQKEHDNKWIQDMSCTFTEPTTESRPVIKFHRRTNSTVIDMTGTSLKLDDTLSFPIKNMDMSTSSGIVFRDEPTNNKTCSSMDDGIAFEDSNNLKYNQMGNELDSKYNQAKNGCKAENGCKPDNGCEADNGSKADNGGKADNARKVGHICSKNICYKGQNVLNKVENDSDEDSYEIKKAHKFSKRQNRDNAPVLLYIQMQLCQKDSLKEWLAVNNDRKRVDIFSIFTQIVDAVHYVHEQKLIHRDLKPSNIFFSIDGFIKVGDFGLVTEMKDCASTDLHTSNASAMINHTKDAGTVLYMSPEQIKGLNYDYKVDIYSLGMVFFELLVSFTTESERYKTLDNLRKLRYPPGFPDNYSQEHTLLNSMLSESPKDRPTTKEIKEWPPLLNYRAT